MFQSLLGALRAFRAEAGELRDELWLNGRLGRTAADCYMMREYAQGELGGTTGVRDVLGISAKAQEKLTASANTLSPLEGGRHARGSGSASWSLKEQRVLTADLLKRWIHYRASASATPVREPTAG
jgi:hypothetical protein